MDDLFRFITIRPPQKAEPATVSIALPTNLQERLKGARGREESKAIASWFVGTPNYVAGPTDLRFGKELVELRRRLLARGESSTPNDVKLEVTNVFHIELGELIAVPDFRSDMARVYDSILATYISPPAYRGSLALLVELALTIGLIDRVSRNDPAINAPGAVAAALNGTVAMPEQACVPHQARPRPVGVMDLLVVKQHLKGYELGEIARIENVLQGEKRQLTRKHTLSTEQITVTELERITEEEKELEIKERFALKKETENTLKEDTSVKSGVSLTAKYGESLQVSANVNVDYSNAKSEATKMASEYAKDVTTRAASKVTERFREQFTRRVLETFEDTDFQEFTSPTENVVGIYQWVNKVYEAQVFNYGKRLLFDIMVPEPAAFLLDAVDITEQSGTPEKPLAFDVLPSDLSDDPLNDYYYGKFVARYMVSGISVPPPKNITVSFAQSGPRQDGKNPLGHSEVEIPIGYEARKAYVQGVFDPVPGTGLPIQLNVLVGTKLAIITDHTEQPPPPGIRQELHLDSADVTGGGYREAKKLPIAFGSYGLADFALTVDVLCELQDVSWEDWKVKTHSAIVQAYNKLMDDYKDKIAAQAFQKSSSPILGGNTDQNRRTERMELKKGCIALLIEGSQRNLLDFDGVKDDPPTANEKKYPRPDPDKAYDEGKFIRFFEQAFEWEHMMYFFYPYFWGRRATWYDKIVDQNADALFLDFLRAGAARVVIPVRPTFEADVRYFLCRDEIWGGGDLPDVADEKYLSIVEEIKEATGAVGTEKPQGKPWDIRIPTSLIKLRKDGKLPKWTRPDPQKWEWVSVPPEDA